MILVMFVCLIFAAASEKIVEVKHRKYFMSLLHNHLHLRVFLPRERNQPHSQG